MKYHFTDKKTKSYIIKFLLFSIMILMINISCNKIEKSPDVACGCDTVDLGIDTTYRYTTLDIPPWETNTNGYLWTWTKRHDTIQVGGYYDNGGEGGGSIHMFFKKNDTDCVDFLFVRYIEYEDALVLDADTNELISPWYYMDVFYNGTVTLQIQEYVEDSIFVGQVGNIKFWMEFKPEYEHPEPWRYEVVPNP